MQRWDRIGRSGAYGAALALVPYVLIKVFWVAGSLVGLLPVGAGFGLAEWVALNTVTIAMAATGIALALALVRPWGMRIPGAPVAFCAWVGSGFLVSLLPFGVLSTLLGSGGGAGDGAGGGPVRPAWEGLLMQLGFLGTGLGLALAVPAYLRRRWPQAFTGHVGDAPRTVPRWEILVSAAVGTVWLYWAAGGTLGIAHPAERTTDGYALGAVCGFWALAASVAVHHITRVRPGGPPPWLALVSGWVGSGSLFAWSGWKLPFTLYAAAVHPAGFAPPENPAVAVVLQLGAVAAGAAMLRTLVRGANRPSAVPGIRNASAPPAPRSSP